MRDQAKQLRALLDQQPRNFEIISLINPTDQGKGRRIGYELATILLKQQNKVLYLCDDTVTDHHDKALDVMKFEQLKTDLAHTTNHSYLNKFSMMVIETDRVFNQSFIEKVRITTYPIFIFDCQPKKLIQHYELIKYISQIKHQEASFMMINSNSSKLDDQLVEEMIKVCQQFLNFKLTFLGYYTHERVNEQSDSRLVDLSSELMRVLQRKSVETNVTKIKQQLNLH